MKGFEPATLWSVSPLFLDKTNMILNKKINYSRLRLYGKLFFSCYISPKICKFVSFALVDPGPLILPQLKGAAQLWSSTVVGTPTIGKEPKTDFYF